MTNPFEQKEPLSERIIFRLNKPSKDWLTKTLEEKGVSESDFLRQMLSAYFAAQEGKKRK